MRQHPCNASSIGITSVTGRLVGVAAMVLLTALPQLASAAIFDIAAGDVAGLIAAIDTANGNGEANTINLAVGSNPYSIFVVNNSIDGDTGLPSVTSEIIINGNGAIIERNIGTGFSFRIFHVATSGKLTLNDLTVQQGKAVDSATLSIGGGGILNGGTLTITNSTLSGNHADRDGGGIFNRPGGTLTVTNSTLSSSGFIPGNSAFFGGGIANGGTAMIANSTLSNNSTMSLGSGGGIFNDAGETPLTITNSTLLQSGINNHSGPLTITNSIVADSPSSVNCSSSGTSSPTAATWTRTGPVLRSIAASPR